MSRDVYALKQPHPDGSEWIQEHDSLEDALSYREHSGGILVVRTERPGRPGLWWVEVVDGEVAPAEITAGFHGVSDTEEGA